MSARAFFGFLLASVLLTASAQVELFRWVDADGSVHYSDQPPPPNIRNVQQMQVTSKPGEQPWPYQLQQAARNFPVTFFVSDCGEACAQARKLLSKRGIPHTEFDATEPAFQEQLKKLIGGDLVVPVLTVGKSVLRGFEAGQWNTALDAAGYPGSALIKLTPTKAARPEPPAAASPEESVAPPDGAEPAPVEEVESGN